MKTDKELLRWALENEMESFASSLGANMTTDNVIKNIDSLLKMTQNLKHIITRLAGPEFNPKPPQVIPRAMEDKINFSEEEIVQVREDVEPRRKWKRERDPSEF